MKASTHWSCSRLHRSFSHCPVRRLPLRPRCQATPFEARSKTTKPVQSQVASFAPATVANFGPGFDWLGCAVQGDGDVVVASKSEKPGVDILSIDGDGGRLSLNPTKNCIGIAAIETLKAINTDEGVTLKLKKGLPLGSGLGSSAASAAASAHAVNALFGSPLTKQQLILPGLEAEASVSGYHADNIAPAVLGGFVMILSTDPLKIERLFCPTVLCFALVTPEFEAPTAKMRSVLPKKIPMKDFVHNSCMSGLMMSGIHEGDPEKIGAALNAEAVVEPVRGPLIPGFSAVKAAALKSGAYGCTISGAGPTVLAVIEDEASGAQVVQSMSNAFRDAGHLNVQKAQIVHIDIEGVRITEE